MHLQHALSPTQLQGRRVFVYKNLHEDCWSVKDRQTGHVVAHADKVELSDVELKVSEAGRQRVLQEHRKNVHAGLVGKLQGLSLHKFSSSHATLAGAPSAAPRGMAAITYNPYKFSTFVTKPDFTPALTADRAVLDADGHSVWALNPHG